MARGRCGFSWALRLDIVPGNAVTTCLVCGEPEVDPVVQDHDSLSGGVGGGFAKLGGFGADLGAGGMYIGVS